MERISSYALALSILLAAPALADDWDLPDTMSKTVLAQRDAENDTDEENTSEDDAANQPALHDGGREESESAGGSQPGSTTSVDSAGRYQLDGSSEASVKVREAPEAGDQRTSNVLGPLWGTPQDAPVMKNIDPELEKQYARDSQGRLVPRSELSKEDAERLRQEEKQQRAADREAKFARDREDRAAKAEQKRLAREEAKARDLQERQASEADRARERQSMSGGTEPPENESEQPEIEEEADAPAEDGTQPGERDAFLDHKVGGRSTPESEGW